MTMTNNEKIVSQGPALPSDTIFEAINVPNMDQTVRPLPEWKVSGIFSTHMVLQRNRPITIWGWSSHIGAQVKAEWEKEDGLETAAGIVDENGRFEVTFAPRPASFEPTRMRVFSKYGEEIFEDILVGDVWVIGGQSNAELNLEPCLVDTPEIAASFCEERPFRLFSQTQAGAMECTQFHYVPARDIIKPEWCWKLPGEEAAKTFSAIGYYLAYLVQPKIDIPMGIVMMAAGGACLRELMPVELAQRLGYMEGANMPVGGYYNTLIAPLIGLQFTGQIFFQGESEGIWVEMAHSYGEDLAAFVEDERQRFGFDFSFYNIQLSSYREECDDYFKHLYWVRASQHKALSLIPNSYLTVARDLGSLPGEPDFAHSPHKYALTRRVAAQVLAAEYGIGELKEAYSPLPVKAVRNKNLVTVSFDCVNGGLCIHKTAGISGDEKDQSTVQIRGFSFMDTDGREVWAKAWISDRETVCVEIPEGADGAEVHYSMSNMAYMEQADLCGGTGLPVPAFVAAVEG